MDPDILIDLNSRVRALEKKQIELKEKVLVINRNMLEEFKAILNEIKDITKDLKDIKDSTAKFQGTIKQIVNEMDSFASKDQMKALEKYINLWNPLNFITEGEARNLIESIVKEKQITLKSPKGDLGRKQA